MEDMCPKCKGWIFESPTAEMMEPDTWCDCFLYNNPSGIPTENPKPESI